MKKQVFNPFLPLYEYIPDGEPHIFGDRVYLYGSHDMEGGSTFCMLDYTVYSAPINDLSDWKCEGTVYRAEQDPDYSERKYMYAPDAVQGNDGKFYLYYCMSGECGKGGYFGPVQVAVSDTPCGKFEYLGFVKYPDGSPMKKYVCFDPAVINDDGVIRLYYGTQYMNESIDELKSSPEKLEEVMERYNKSADEILSCTDNVNGPCTVILDDDMITVKSEPVHIMPYESDFGGHEFFEASSMRKINGKYYFIYSSQKNHELCYAVSDLPDRDFKFMGTIVSNGDIGVNGVTEQTKLNMTGTTHGSIIEINGQWYVFYHRLTHKSDYSRQACAERIEIQPDGTIKQAEMTSCGLNGKPLQAKGTYPAVIACNITNGNMPHGSNKIFSESFPNVTNDGDERFIAEISDGTLIGYKYFDFKNVKKIILTLKGSANGTVKIMTQINSLPVAEVNFCASENWVKAVLETSIPDGTHPLYIVYSGSGQLCLKEISFEI